MGLLAYTCISFPQYVVSVLLFFVIPIRMSLRTLFCFLLAFEGGSFLFCEVLRSGSIAHSAHLGGLISGVLYFSIQKYMPSTNGHH
jgi:membrane associated rhomboid family serine protease